MNNKSRGLNILDQLKQSEAKRSCKKVFTMVETKPKKARTESEVYDFDRTSKSKSVFEFGHTQADEDKSNTR